MDVKGVKVIERVGRRGEILKVMSFMILSIFLWVIN